MSMTNNNMNVVFVLKQTPQPTTSVDARWSEKSKTNNAQSPSFYCNLFFSLLFHQLLLPLLIVLLLIYLLLTSVHACSVSSDSSSSDLPPPHLCACLFCLFFF
uniref:Uncharacterized protein n=1 Tax=Cacopsylla melanoneura TaxID=428564 RepID=A0A8D8ZA75_9HEMI